MDGVGGVAFFLHIPDSKEGEIQNRSISASQRCQEYSRHWLSHHPSPSWLVVANALYIIGEHGALEVLQKFYLKGEYIPEWELMGNLVNNYLL